MRFIRYFLMIIAMMFVAGCGSSTLQPFTTDGCSRFPDGTLGHRDLWLKCCTEHDVDYWQGGTKGERKAADRRLRECVSEVGEPGIADLMYTGMRAGGSPYLPTSYRWGYGWSYGRGYKALTAEEKVFVEELIIKNAE